MVILTAISIYGGAAIQIQSNIDTQRANAVTNRSVQAPTWVAFRALSSGSVISNYCRNSITTAQIDTSLGVGKYRVTMPAHPLGSNYGIFVVAKSGIATIISSSVLSSTQFTVSTYTSGGTASSAAFTVCTVD